MERGFVQVYTGDGKGKTTAAVGLALRALANGFKVCFIQFLKGDPCIRECSILQEKFAGITVITTGTRKFITDKPTEEDIGEAERGLREAKKAIHSNEYDLVILDEINHAIDLKLIELDEILKIIENRPAGVELVLTGRNAKKEIIDAADLVTEMKSHKHYYEKGIEAREGIEK